MDEIPIIIFMNSFEKKILGGDFDYFLKPKKYIKKEFFDNYFDDTEHGFFHAFCCSFVSYVINNYNFDNLLISYLLLHDFLKCSGFSQEKHYVELENYYPNLLKETYSHSNPPDDTKLLIVCDRIELQRYPDYKDWVDSRFLNILNSVSIKRNKEIKIFYEKVRPALLYYYEKRNINDSNIIITNYVETFYSIIEKTRKNMEMNNKNNVDTFVI